MRVIGLILFRLVPAAVFFSLFFTLDGGLKWIGLFGIVPLVLLWQRVPGCGACQEVVKDTDTEENGGADQKKAASGDGGGRG